MNSHVGCLQEIRGNNYHNAWNYQKKLLEYGFHCHITFRTCISILHEENSEWTAPFILQTARESRSLVYHVDHLSFVLVCS